MIKRLLFLLAFIVFHFVGNCSQALLINVKDSISTNTTWSYTDSLHNCIQYLIKGTVYVTSGNTLTIDSGTIIRGDKATKGTLVIEQGAKLICNGTYNMPIMFTSNEPQGSRTYGDWGGIIICGKAPLNTNTSPLKCPWGIRSYYGGNIVSDNSGKLSYVRIEFAGTAMSPNNEINGLTLCGVGNGTQIDHIQVSYSGNDSYGWFGGTVNAKYLVSHRAWDDDFETNQGYTGMVQYGIALRDPNAADQSGSIIFECNGFETTNPLNPTLLTAPVFSNITAVGPLVNAASTTYDIQHIAAARWRKGAGMSIVNSVLIGHIKGIYIEEPVYYPSTVAKIGNYNVLVRNNIIAGMISNREIFYKCDTCTLAYDSISPVNWSAMTGFSGPWNWLKNTTYFNRLYASGTNGVRLQNPFDLTSPKFNPTSTSPICFNNGQNYLGQTIAGLKTFNTLIPINLDTTNNYANYNAPAAIPDFTSTKASNAFFDKVNYIGALPYNTGDWLYGWTNFDPNNTFIDYVPGPCWGSIVEQQSAGIQSATLYPNPAKNNTTVSIYTSNNTRLKIILTDMMGRIVAEVFNGVATEGQKENKINLQQLRAGVYNVVVSSDDERKNLKLMLQ